MKISKFTLNPIQENTYIVSDEDNNAVIIDPGCYFSEERELIRNHIAENNLNLMAILNTHGHLDHIMGNAFLKREYGVDIYLHQSDLPTMEMAKVSAEVFGLRGFEESPTPDKFIKEGEILTFGKITFEVIFGPGHAPGHVAFYSGENDIVINGDILFRGSYGRVDLPGGDFQTLKHTIIDKMFRLPNETVVYSGHGPETTIGYEKENNPILW
ncbi:MAG: MBL fold metallo-hydrolase [Brumimicrobium sp.]